MTSANDLSVPLTEEELDELDQFLMSPTVSDETMLIDMLDGYLTAIAIGPTTLLFEEWFPGIWGPSEEDMPQFSSMEEAQHIIGLIFRRMNSIITVLENDPDTIEPLFEYVVAEDGEEIFDGEGWAYGFIAGINLCKPDWGPLIQDEESRQAFFPIFLLGSDELQPELEKHIDSPELRAALTAQLTDSIAKIYRFWLPYRHAQQANAANLRTREAKIGRNDPCPCGSGKKFKKCCGA